MRRGRWLAVRDLEEPPSSRSVLWPAILSKVQRLRGIQVLGWSQSWSVILVALHGQRFPRPLMRLLGCVHLLDGVRGDFNSRCRDRILLALCDHRLGRVLGFAPVCRAQVDKVRAEVLVQDEARILAQRFEGLHRSFLRNLCASNYWLEL